MADPAIVTVSSSAWTLVATNVTSGRIKIGSNKGSMRITYRETGGAAPTGAPLDGGKEDGVESEYIEISHSSPIDVYMTNTLADANVVVWL